MRDLGLIQERRAGGAAVHPGHGDQERREDVEVEGQCRFAGRDDRALWRRCGAHVLALCRAAGPRSGLAGGRRRRGQPLSVARVSLRDAACGSWRDASSGAAPEASPAATALLRKLHQTIRKITQDFGGRWHFNTSIAAIMELVNELTAADAAIAEGKIPPATVANILESLVLMLAPFAPHLAAELWEQIGRKRRRPAPSVAEVRRGVGTRRRDRGAGADQRQAARVDQGAGGCVAEMPEAAARADEKVQAALAGKTVVKVIVVPGKLINFVVR